MEQPKWQALKSREPWFLALALCAAVAFVTTIAALIVTSVAKPSFLFDSSSTYVPIWGRVSGAVFVLAFFGMLLFLGPRDAALEDQARQRVRQAEDKLSSELRGSDLHLINEQIARLLNDDAIAEVAKVTPFGVVERPTDVTEALAAGSLLPERREDRLTLAALWDVTHGRMDLYHQIVTGQARSSFRAAQVAMGFGFVVLVVFAVVAVQAKTTTGAITTASLGAVGAAFAAYIGKTFIRSQESAASHLRAYFDQPLELSRYLAAERLLADAKELSPEQRAAILTSLVQSIAGAGHDDAKSGKPAGRQPRGRASR
jgi:hypothetical protein